MYLYVMQLCIYWYVDEFALRSSLFNWSNLNMLHVTLISILKICKFSLKQSFTNSLKKLAFKNGLICIVYNWIKLKI